MKRCYIGLGSNLGDPVQQVCKAIRALSRLPYTEGLVASSLYQSEPMGPPQPDFINAVVQIDTDLEPFALLRACQNIESDLGRVRTAVHWGPRAIDVDLLLYGQDCIQVDDLTVPHPGLACRDFVLVPLLEIAPTLMLPDGQRAADVLAGCPRGRLEKHSLVSLEEVL